MRGFRRTLLIRSTLAFIALGIAQAHFTLVQPPSALAIDNGGKGAPPCGEGPGSNLVTAAQGGHPIPIRLTEFVFHPGHYRFALSVNSRAELPLDPDVVQDSDGNSVSASIQNPVKAPVLADGVFAHTVPPTGDWQTSLTLPNLNCDKCTLQIIEFMAEHGANIGGGFFYHQCADLRITADPNLPPADPAWPRAAAQNIVAAFPHIAAGGGWSTVLTLINTSSEAVSATVGIHGDDGNALTLPVTTTQQGLATTTATSSVNAIVSPNATLLISTGDQIASVRGWADVRSSGTLRGYAVFRSTLATGLPVECTVPLQTQFASAMTLPFDNTIGFVTNVAIANLSTAPASLTAAIWDDSGNDSGTQTIVVAGNSHTEFAMPNLLPMTAGRRGLVRFQGPAAGSIAGLALRFSELGAFISLPVL